MLEYYISTAKSVHDELKTQLDRHICGSYEILRTENSKPYIKGNPVYFSLSHSGETGIFAISDKPVGLDFEILKPREFQSVLSRFTKREQIEIGGDLNKFLINWVAKEAYIKLIGGKVFEDLKNLEFFEGKLYYFGMEKPVYFRHMCGGICAVCTEEKI